MTNNKTEMIPKTKKMKEISDSWFLTACGTTLKYKIATLFFIGGMFFGTGFVLLFPTLFQNILIQVTI